MQHYISVIEKALMQGVLGKRTNALSEMGKIRLGFYALSGLLSMAGIVFITYGAHLFFVTNFSEDIAFIFTGLVCVLFSIFVISLLAVFYYLKLRKYKKIKSEITTSIQSVMNSFAQEAKMPIADNPKTAVAIAGLVGYLLGERI